jgi:hypothetical protein
MIKIIDNITFMGSKQSFMLINNSNKAQINFNKESGRINFRDSVGNTIQNYPSTICINLKVFKLTTLGQVISCSNGNVFVYLSTPDVQELVEKSFYEEEQTRIYDFTNYKFNVELS